MTFGEDRENHKILLWFPLRSQNTKMPRTVLFLREPGPWWGNKAHRNNSHCRETVVSAVIAAQVKREENTKEGRLILSLEGLRKISEEEMKLQVD